MIGRWLLRLLALAALVGVGYGVYIIVREGTEGSDATRGKMQPALRKLSNAQATLGDRLDALRPGAAAAGLPVALRRTQRAHEAAVIVLRRADSENPIRDQEEIGDALGAEFDYLDALRSSLTNRRSPLLRKLGDRAEAAKQAFTDLPDSEGVEDGIRGTQAYLAWARARQ